MTQHNSNNLSAEDQKHVDRIAEHLDKDPHHSQAMRTHAKNQDHKAATDHVLKIGREIGIPLTLASAGGIAWYLIKL